MLVFCGCIVVGRVGTCGYIVVGCVLVCVVALLLDVWLFCCSVCPVMCGCNVFVCMLLCYVMFLKKKILTVM